jgi:hypothetical protein
MTRTSAARRFARLAVQALETREVPANNLTITDALTDTNIDLPNNLTATTTIRTDGADARLSLTTLQNVLKDPTVRTVVVTTAASRKPKDADQPGNLVWDASAVGSLDFTGFGGGKTLRFETVDGTNAVGDITLTAVQFANAGTDDQLSLGFDSSAVGGDITFRTDGTGSGTVKFTDSAVLDLTVDAGTGAFSFTDDGIATPGDVGGSIALTAGPVTLLHSGGLTAWGPVTVTAGGAVALGLGTGLYASSGDLTVTAGGPVTGTDVGLTALAGRIDVSGSAVTLDDVLTGPFLTARAGLSIAGTNGVALSYGGYFVSGDVSLTSTAGPVNILGGGLPNDPTQQHPGNVTVTGTAVGLTDTFLQGDGALSITGPLTVNGFFGGVNLGSGRAMTLTGPITLASHGLSLYAGGPISVAGAVEGPGSLFVSGASTVSFGGTIGAVAPLGSFTLDQGAARIQGNVLKATTVKVGQVFTGVEATLGFGGTLVGDVDVQPTGNLAPGGFGTVGGLTVTGNVDFHGGDFTVDFDPSGSDRLTVIGNVTIDNSVYPSRLGAGLGTGQVPGVVNLILATGALTGKFANTQDNAFFNPVPVLVGTDVAMATYGPNTLDVAPYLPAGGASAVATGVEQDATGFKATLAGGGTLVTGVDWQNFLFLVARNTKPASRLTILTIPNASDDVVNFGAGVLVNGPLALFSAPKVDVSVQLRASGAVTAATFRDFLNWPNWTGVTFGGSLAQLTSITARNLYGSVTTGSTLTRLKVAGGLGAGVGIGYLPDSVVSAPVIGTVTAKTAATHFRTPGALKVLTVGTYAGDITAGSVGTATFGTFNGTLTATGPIAAVKSTGAFVGPVAGASLGRFESDGGGSADLKVAGRIGSVIGKGESDLTLELAADSAGLMQVVGGLGGDGVADGTDWAVTNGIGSLRAGSLGGMDVSAKYLGPVTVTGNTTFGLSGDVQFATFTLTGNDGTLGQYGLRSLSVQGTVSGATFDVRGGNVGPVKVGRFQGSRLYLSYTPNGTFNTGGSFGAKGYRLASFTTTALPAPGAFPPYQWAFQDSEVAADSIGTVTLSGVRTDDGGTAFGIKVHKTGAVLVVKAADAHTQFALNTSLSPKPTAIEDDFYFIRV